MKTLYILPVFIFIMGCEVEQPRNSRHTKFCSCEFEYDGEKFKAEIAPKNLEDEFDELISLVGLSPERFHICLAKEDLETWNAIASQKSGTPYVMLKKDFMKENRTYQTFVLGHEIGHLLSWHTLSSKRKYSPEIDSHQAELEADYFSSTLLALAGYNVNTILKSIPYREESLTHPSSHRRKIAIRNGYRHTEHRLASLLVKENDEYLYDSLNIYNEQ